MNAQDYPKEFYKVFLVADNCTDNTAEIARARGAHVYERENKVEKGKGYALDYLIKCIERDFGDDFCDAVTISDWSRIRGSAFKKVLYAFTFPLFIFSFIPAAFVAIFKKVEWKQVQHKGAPASQAAVTETSENENELITK